jgi:hypothetical protein
MVRLNINATIRVENIALVVVEHDVNICIVMLCHNITSQQSIFCENVAMRLFGRRDQSISRPHLARATTSPLKFLCPASRPSKQFLFLLSGGNGQVSATAFGKLACLLPNYTFSSGQIIYLDGTMRSKTWLDTTFSLVGSLGNDTVLVKSMRDPSAASRRITCTA